MKGYRLPTLPFRIIVSIFSFSFSFIFCIGSGIPTSQYSTGTLPSMAATFIMNREKTLLYSASIYNMCRGIQMLLMIPPNTTLKSQPFP